MFSSLLPADGFRIIYDREVPFELRVQESAEGPQQVGTLEAIKVKVLMLVRINHITRRVHRTLHVKPMGHTWYGCDSRVPTACTGGLYCCSATNQVNVEAPSVLLLSLLLCVWLEER